MSFSHDHRRTISRHRCSQQQLPVTVGLVAILRRGGNLCCDRDGAITLRRPPLDLHRRIALDTSPTTNRTASPKLQSTKPQIFRRSKGI